MKSYEFLPHVADIRLKVIASSLEELFTAALEGMGNLIKSNSCPFKEEDNDNSLNHKNTNNFLKEKIEISSIDSTALLIDFLSEVLTYSQVNNAVYCKIKFEKLNNNFLSAAIFGKTIEKFDEDIKAVTYHEADIRKDAEGNLYTIIIFDI